METSNTAARYSLSLLCFLSYLYQSQFSLRFPPIVGGEAEFSIEKHFHMTSDILQLIHGGTLPFSLVAGVLL